MSTAELKASLQEILKYLGPYWEFVNCHMVNYLTNNHWDQFMPESVRQSVGSANNVNECIEAVFWNSVKSTKFKDVWSFFEESKKFRLENMKHVLTSPEEMHRMLEKNGDVNSLSIKEFMSEKKRHEVEITAELVNDLILSKKRHNSIYIIDAGDGKGYLSSRLALQYKYKVLGIDFSESNTENALERSKKLQRAWNGLTERAELQSQGITPPRRGKKQKSTPIRDQTKPENYKTTNKFITTQLDFVGLLNEFFPLSQLGEYPCLCLTGLHTCGNLASTCLKVFASQPDFRILCNVGCCYHLLKEEYSVDEFFGNKEIMDKQSEVGFPMSDFLRSERVKIGRNARMLAAQSIHRTQHAKELPNKSLFYRALLEVLIVEKDTTLKDTVQVGKIRKFNSFREYVNLCSKKANLGLDEITDQHVNQVEVKYSEQGQLLNLFYLIRMGFAPILESLILLDRLLYLRENGFDQSYLIPLFDPVISPRHFCIVAMK